MSKNQKQKNVKENQKNGYNKGRPYWKVEEPEVIKTGNIEIKYYEEAGALQITLFKGDKVHKNINLRRYKLVKLPDILEKLEAVFNDWQEEIETD